VNIMYRVLLLQGGKIFCHSEYKEKNFVKKKKNLDNKPFTLSLYSISYGRNNEKLGQPEIFCLCFLYSQGVLYGSRPMTD
jgi:hypothetical protein